MNPKTKSVEQQLNSFQVSQEFKVLCDSNVKVGKLCFDAVCRIESRGGTKKKKINIATYRHALSRNK